MIYAIDVVAALFLVFGGLVACDTGPFQGWKQRIVVERYDPDFATNEAHELDLDIAFAIRVAAVTLSAVGVAAGLVAILFTCRGAVGA